MPTGCWVRRRGGRHQQRGHRQGPRGRYAVQPGSRPRLCRRHTSVAGRPETTHAIVEELNRLCERYDFTYYREWGLLSVAGCRAAKRACRSAKRGISALAAQSAFARMPYWLSLQARMLADLAEHDASRATLDAAIAASAARDEPWWLPEICACARRMTRRARADRLRSAMDLARALDQPCWPIVARPSCRRRRRQRSGGAFGRSGGRSPRRAVAER